MNDYIRNRRAQASAYTPGPSTSEIPLERSNDLQTDQTSSGPFRQQIGPDSSKIGKNLWAKARNLVVGLVGKKLGIKELEKIEEKLENNVDKAKNGLEKNANVATKAKNTLGGEFYP